MLKIIRLEPIESIKPGEPPDIAPDGTIRNPEPYHACNVTLDDGTTVQVERPLTLDKIKKAHALDVNGPIGAVDNVSVGDELPPNPWASDPVEEVDGAHEGDEISSVGP